MGWHQALFELAGLWAVAFSSPFDLSAVAFLRRLNVLYTKDLLVRRFDGYSVNSSGARTVSRIIMSTAIGGQKTKIDDAVSDHSGP